MTLITIAHQLPFVRVVLHANGQSLLLERVLLDTGSAASIFRTDDLAKIGITIAPEDKIRYMSGVGGREAVIEKRIEAIEVGDLVARPFTVQMGAIEYGIPMDGILGNDFLLQTGAVINFRSLSISRL
jgi:Aspartyl protease